MKLTRYIRPRARRTAAQQIAATERPGIAITIVEGEQGRTWADAVKQLRPGGGLLIENLAALGRRRDTVCDRLDAVFAKGASVVLGEDDSVHSPDCGPSLLAGVRARGVTVSGDEPKPRVAPNKLPDAVRDQAERYWKQKQFERMTNREIAEAAGVSVETLASWFGARGNYVNARRGRPPKRKQ
jgi:hypothetical protein